MSASESVVRAVASTGLDREVGVIGWVVILEGQLAKIAELHQPVDGYIPCVAHGGGCPDSQEHWCGHGDGLDGYLDFGRDHIPVCAHCIVSGRYSDPDSDELRVENGRTAYMISDPGDPVRYRFPCPTMAVLDPDSDLS